MEEQRAERLAGEASRHSGGFAARVSAAMGDPEFADMMERLRRERYDEQSRMVKRGMAAKAAAGGWNGPAPLGYVNRRRGDRAWVEVDPVAGPLVREAFELYSTGRYSLRGLLAVVAEKGLRSSRHKPLSPAAMARILSNQFYMGTVRTEGAFVLGTHEPLVDGKTFWKAQGVLARARTLLTGTGRRLS